MRAGQSTDIPADFKLTSENQAYLRDIIKISERMKISSDEKAYVSGIMSLIGLELGKFKTPKRLSEFLESALASKANLGIDAVEDQAVRAHLGKIKESLERFQQWLFTDNIKQQEIVQNARIRPDNDIVLDRLTNQIINGFRIISELPRDIAVNVNASIADDRNVAEKRKALAKTVIELMVTVAVAGCIVQFISQAAALAAAESYGTDAPRTNVSASLASYFLDYTTYYASYIVHESRSLIQEASPEEEKVTKKVTTKDSKDSKAENKEIQKKEIQKLEQEVEKFLVMVTESQKDVQFDSSRAFSQIFDKLGVAITSRNNNVGKTTAVPITKTEIETHFETAKLEVKAELELKDEFFSPSDIRQLIKEKFEQRIKNEREEAINRAIQSLSPPEKIAKEIALNLNEEKGQKYIDEISLSINRIFLANVLCTDYNSSASQKNSYQPCPDKKKDVLNFSGYKPFIKGKSDFIYYFSEELTGDKSLLRALDATPTDGKMDPGGKYTKAYARKSMPSLEADDVFGYPKDENRIKDTWRSQYVISQILGQPTNPPEPPIPCMKSPENIVNCIKKILIANASFNTSSHPVFPEKKGGLYKPSPTPLYLLLHSPDLSRMLKNKRVMELLPGILTDKMIFQALTDLNIQGRDDRPRMVQAVNDLFDLLRRTHFFTEKRLEELYKMAREYITLQCEHPLHARSRELEIIHTDLFLLLNPSGTTLHRASLDSHIKQFSTQESLAHHILPKEQLDAAPIDKLDLSRAAEKVNQLLDEHNRIAKFRANAGITEVAIVVDETPKPPIKDISISQHRAGLFAAPADAPKAKELEVDLKAPVPPATPKA